MVGYVVEFVSEFRKKKNRGCLYATRMNLYNLV